MSVASIRGNCLFQACLTPLIDIRLSFPLFQIQRQHSPLQCSVLIFGLSLPSLYEGGRVVVRRAGHETILDWSSKCKEDICQATFYSDCEHEDTNIVRGYRVTLMYTMCLSLGFGDLASKCHIMDVKAFPLYRKVEELSSISRKMNISRSTKPSGAIALSALNRGRMIPDIRPYPRVGRLGDLCVTVIRGNDSLGWEDILKDWKHQSLDIQWSAEPSKTVREKGFVRLTVNTSLHPTLL